MRINETKIYCQGAYFPNNVNAHLDFNHLFAPRAEVEVQTFENVLAVRLVADEIVAGGDLPAGWKGIIREWHSDDDHEEEEKRKKRKISFSFVFISAPSDRSFALLGLLHHFPVINFHNRFYGKCSKKARQFYEEYFLQNRLA